ncbi:MAG: hypothetical protein H6618_04305 [Deltaproteobacteria bacterium]|nr:hypothetical protein [Deltaproteobacteria bacterium]
MAAMNLRCYFSRESRKAYRFRREFLDSLAVAVWLSGSLLSATIREADSAETPGASRLNGTGGQDESIKTQNRL